MSSSTRYRTLTTQYDAYLDSHGDSHRGVGWPVAEDVDKRHRVMLELLKEPIAGRSRRLLDFGCGLSHLYEYILRERIPDIEYAGLDISPRAISIASDKFPNVRYWCLDLLTAADDALPRFDYAVINGVFTAKFALSFDEMFAFMTRTVERLFTLVDVGLAFNVMSKHVDWERDDLFHLPLDTLARWLTTSVGRNYVIRNDYGLYEYTTYVYR